MAAIKIDVRKLKNIIKELARDAAGERGDNCVESGVAVGKIGDVQVQVICSGKGDIRFPLRAKYRCLETKTKKENQQ